MRLGRMLAGLALALALPLSGGCDWYAYYNQKASQSIQAGSPRSDFTLAQFKPGKNGDRTLVVLSLSGGGSRAAYFAGAAMLQLSKVFDGIDLLRQVDAISSVSGGSLTAAYYAVSRDSADTADGWRPEWTAEQVKETLSFDYRNRWLWRWLYPQNIVRYWFTAFDRTDIMAELFADRIFNRDGESLGFKDLNPRRPALFLNATIDSQAPSAEDRLSFGNPFTFTKDDFEQLVCSDWEHYPIARGVMASATFPLVFQDMTLRNYCRDPAAEYVQLFDGGNFDNLGLKTAQKIVDDNQANFDQVVVILVDAYAEDSGVSPATNDPRRQAKNLMSFLFDMNAADAPSALLKSNRYGGIDGLARHLADNIAKPTLFYHLKFENVCTKRRIENGAKTDMPLCDADSKLYNDLRQIRTDFRLTAEGAEAIDRAVETVLVKDNDCLERLRDMLAGNGPQKGVQPYCTWNPPEG